MEALGETGEGGKSAFWKGPFYRGFWGLSFDNSPFPEPDTAEPFWRA